MRCCRTGLKTKRKFQLFSLKAKYSASFRSSSTFFVSRQQEAKLVTVLLHSSFLLEDPELLATADVDYTSVGCGRPPGVGVSHKLPHAQSSLAAPRSGVR